jgi:cation diffusion facilitator CzcD-associated flavoprotein CzcO
VIGAGPFGLAVAAHLKSAKVVTRVFGEPMSFWQRHMPDGMRLRSPWAASYIADPQRKYSLDAYAAVRGFDPFEQMPVGEFIGYGRWFQLQAVPDCDTRKVVSVEATARGFSLHLDDGESVQAGRVVVATGLAHQDFRPEPFVGLPSEMVSHSCDHATLKDFSGRRVAVIGRGQSACESAALLAEAGADVELICRGPVLWLGADRDDGSRRRDLAWLIRQFVRTRTAVGPFPLNWLAQEPGFVHLLPDALRNEFSARCLQPKASGWLRSRFAAVRINSGQTISRAHITGSRVTLDLATGSSTFDRVVLGTGYRIDIAKQGILSAALLRQVATVDGAPRLSHGMESSVRGLHFVGATAVHSYGPLMRFVCGAEFAARNVTAGVLADRGHGRLARREAENAASLTSTPKTVTHS